MTTPSPPEPKLWGVERTASELGVHQATIYRWCKTKHIPHIRVGSLLKFEPAKVKAWLDERAIEAVK